MNNLSVIILTDRVDERFERALLSAEFATEIVVVLSNGAKLNRNQSPKLKIVHLPGQITDFAAARNQVLEYATYDWVLFLDSDEAFPDEADQILMMYLDILPINGGYIYRQDVFHNQVLKWGEAGNMALLRLAKKNQLRFDRPVHEVAQVTGAIKRLPLTIKHYAHQSISEFWQAICHYSQLEAQHRYSVGNKFSVWQLLLYPPGKFVLNYIFKLGVLDGWRGLVYAVMMSCHSMMVRIYLYELTHK